MRFRLDEKAGVGPAAWRCLLLATTLLSSSSSVGVWAKKDAPSVSSTDFKYAPVSVQYFANSEVVLFYDEIEHSMYRSEDAGASWDLLKDAGEGKVVEYLMHPFDEERAYVFSSERKHWVTGDRGKTWREFDAGAPQPSMYREALSFHADDPDRIIFNGMDCEGLFCGEVATYTTDGFKTDAKPLRTDTAGCHWAKSSELFTTGDKDMDKNRILCITMGLFSAWKKDYRLAISDDYFQSSGGDIQEFEPELEPGRTVQGIVNIAVVKKYLVTAAVAEGTDEMALYVSDDAIKWHRGEFPHDHKLTEESYTILEGTNYSIQVDVMNSRLDAPMGVLFSSNSNGTYFTRNIEHTNRNAYGLVDFEKVAGIQGIVLVNTVDNWEDVEEKSAKKKIKSQISFDDGRTFQPLKVGDDDLHLHSVTDLSNSGRVFSSPAPGLVMGVGNTGKYLDDYNDGDLYVSDDAGLTWRKALSGPHKYEFGDQGSVLVAIKDDYTKEISYSLNHGKDWDTVKLPAKVAPIQLTTTPDSSSLKFLLEAIDDGEGSKSKSYIMVIDFDDMHEGKCKDKDMEDWYARVDEDGKPTCVMGHKQYFRRRKADADCFIKKEFEPAQAISEPCECTDADFECDYNFVRSEDRKECKQAGNLIAPQGECKNADDTFKGSSGWRLIPGNECKRTSDKQKDDPVERKCSEAIGGTPASGNVDNKQQTFKGEFFANRVYLERTGVSAGNDETIILRTSQQQVFISRNHGKTWDEILKGEKIIQIYTHPYFNDVVYFLTASEKVFYSIDRGNNIRSFKAEFPPVSDSHPVVDINPLVMSFHPKNKDWIIWIGATGCDSNEGCHSVASISTNRGDRWDLLQRYVKKCEFLKEAENQKRDEKLIFCEVNEREEIKPDNPWRLVSSDNFFQDPPTVHFENILEFAQMSEFIVVASKDGERDTLKVDATVDGKTFADARFPYGFEVPHQRAYTVLESSTHSVFLHVTTNTERGFEYGAIIKSNSNGTSYVMSLEAVNRDGTGYVDFEKLAGIEGAALANIVMNYKGKHKDDKALKTVITHNDGAEWDYVPVPTGKKFDCKGNLEQCSLNIHGFTERRDKSHTFSSASAIGLVLGVGNVGLTLGPYKEADTFMSTDAGITWKFVKEGPHMWQFGDQGSIIVIVRDGEPTNVLYYTLDEGDNWTEYKFSDDKVNVDDISTVPSSTARNFLLWGRDSDRKLVTINVDFSGLTDKQCVLDENDVEGGDYYLWQPSHPKQKNNCLFGHISEFHRKRTTSDCYNGRLIPHLHNIAKNCSCTRQDYECDYNYQRQTDGSCALVPGLSPPDHSEVCKNNPDALGYYEPTGYRRIPLTTCQGGTEYDVSKAHPCPGKDEEFNKGRGISGWGIFFAIMIPIIASTAAGYWVYNNWNRQFGQIRLGEQSSFDSEQPYIKYPVMVVAGVAAVAASLPLLASSLWRSATNAFGRGQNRRFTTRDSFARGRGDYAVVDDDEGELLGDESDDEVQ
ncbi:hypothetical protein F5884DRAFT_763859 [Xylogone sp. PMI_703]|nr:hypothetical protein F5884DRAFT_763859 [Xylogone sp. PMI_703]